MQPLLNKREKGRKWEEKDRRNSPKSTSARPSFLLSGFRYVRSISLKLPAGFYPLPSLFSVEQITKAAKPLGNLQTLLAGVLPCTPGRTCHSPPAQPARRCQRDPGKTKRRRSGVSFKTIHMKHIPPGFISAGTVTSPPAWVATRFRRAAHRSSVVVSALGCHAGKIKPPICPDC